MNDAPHNGLSKGGIERKLDAVALRLQSILEQLQRNADNLAGQMFHVDELFSGLAEGTRLDDMLANAIEDLRTLRDEIP